MAKLSISLTAWRATCSTLHVIAITSTMFRLGHRWRMRRLWFDDYWALAALVSDVVYFSGIFMRTLPGDPSKKLQDNITLFWLTSVFFPLVVWSARISIAMSIIRITPPQTTARRLLYCMSAAFGMVCIILLSQKLWVCTRDTSWHNTQTVQCLLGTAIGIISLCTDVVSDTLLIAIPVYMLWNVRLPTAQRRLILAIFTSSIFSSLAGVQYAAFVFKAADFGPARGLLMGLAANLKATITLMVCNLLVIVTYIYRVMHKGVDIEATEPFETRDKDLPPPIPTAITFTTIVSDDNSNSSNIRLTTMSNSQLGSRTNVTNSSRGVLSSVDDSSVIGSILALPEDAAATMSACEVTRP